MHDNNTVAPTSYSCRMCSAGSSPSSTCSLLLQPTAPPSAVLTRQALPAATLITIESVKRVKPRALLTKAHDAPISTLHHQRPLVLPAQLHPVTVVEYS
mmetsp:Transcript_37439/g.67055  ORF Transcript_37439/g.67055 Transcript_37439/m.67055 type:complete len:99 (-) Transcript_37439:109-405(-)